jgi:hypothetical protein
MTQPRPLPPPLPYRMESPRLDDCGPASVSAATGIPRREVDAAWGRWRGDVTDSPAHHERALARLGVGRTNHTITDVVERRAPPARTIVLLHDRKNPYFRQHWAVLAGYSPSGEILVAMGNGHTNVLSPRAFVELTTAGWPNVVYSVGDGENYTVPSPPWWQRLWAWMTGG